MPQPYRADPQRPLVFLRVPQRGFSFTDGFPVATVALGQIRTGDYTEMAGLDWSRQRNLLVTPLRRPAPPQVQGQITAIYLLEPLQDAIVNGRYTQVSFPQAFISGSSRVWDNDLLSAFSPDSNQIARKYLRIRSG